MAGLLSEIISLLMGGITGVATALGQGLSALAGGIFTVTADGATSLSVFGGLIIIFAAISLALGLGRWVVNFVTSLGAHNS